MKDAVIKIVDEKDLEFAGVLQSLGLSRNVASVIIYLIEAEEGSSRNIEMATSLRQPEVSIATKTLREKGWIMERDVKGNGKGRPLKIYSMRTSIDEIIRYYKEQKNQEATTTMEAIQRLKELSSA
jgi:predicted transcriptional regulator